MHDYMGETTAGSDLISSKNGPKEEVAIADLIKGAFGLAAAKGAVQVYPNSTDDDFGDDRVDEQRIALPESSDYNTDLQVDDCFAMMLSCTGDMRYTMRYTACQSQLCIAGIHKVLLKLGVARGAGSLTCKEAVAMMLSTLNTLLESETYLLLQVKAAMPSHILPKSLPPTPARRASGSVRRSSN
jgi:hypothetical protein